MSKRKLFILFTVVLAIGALSAVAGIAGDYRDGGTFTPWTSFTYGDCTVETAPTFPEIYDCPSVSGKCSKYCYKFSNGCNVSHAIMQIGQDIVANFYEAYCDGNNCTDTWKPRCDGTSDPNTIFGEFIVSDCNVKIDTSISNELCLIFDGTLGTRPGDMYMKGGQSYAFGPINGPGPTCGEPSLTSNPLLQFDIQKPDGVSVRVCLVENDSSNACFDDFFGSLDTSLSCSQIVANPANRLSKSPSGVIKANFDGVEKELVYVGSPEDSCVVDYWRFLEPDGNNVQVFTVGGYVIVLP